MTYTLHMVFNPEKIDTATMLIEPTDKVLLMQDSCFLANKLSDMSNLYVRKIDIEARNMQTSPNIKVIDDKTWFLLVENSQNTMSW